MPGPQQGANTLGHCRHRHIPVVDVTSGNRRRDDDIEHQKHDAGDHGSRKETRHGCFRDRSVDDEYDRRRNQDPQRPSSGDGGCRITLGIACPLHFRKRDARHARRCRDRRTADRAEGTRCGDGSDRKPATHPRHDDARCVEQFPRHARPRRHLSHEDEQRYHRKGVARRRVVGDRSGHEFGHLDRIQHRIADDPADRQRQPHRLTQHEQCEHHGDACQSEREGTQSAPSSPDVASCPSLPPRMVRNKATRDIQRIPASPANASVQRIQTGSPSSSDRSP